MPVVRDPGRRPVRNDRGADVGRAHDQGNVGNAGNVRNAGDVQHVDNGGARGTHGTDSVDRTPGTSTNRTANITGPYAALAKRGDFSGYVMTASGQELFVSVRVAKKDAGNEKPLVYLDGLAARRNRSDMMADKFRDDGGRTVISILLPGQGETLLKDLQKNRGRSINHDLKDSDQANAVIEVLDALGVNKPVDIFGLSYGGAIAAATERDHGARIDNVMLVAPHVRSQARDEMGELQWNFVANNPWNPMGNAWYRSAAKSTLSKAFGERDLFKDHPGSFAEALFRLSMGIDKNELQRTTKGAENVHILVAEGDGASNPKYNKLAVESAKSGSLTMAPDAFKGQHDLVTASPEMVVAWVTGKLNPERSDEVNAKLTESIKKRIVIETAQGMIGAAAKKVMDGVNKPPAEAFGDVVEGAKMCAVAANAALEAVKVHGRAALELVENAAKMADEAAKLAEQLGQAIGNNDAAKLAKEARGASDIAQKLLADAKKIVDG